MNDRQLTLGLVAPPIKPPDYSLNNSYRAFYARLIMRNAPDLDGFFEVRAQKPSSKTEGNPL